MSIEIILIPLAIGAFSAWQAKRAENEQGAAVVEVSTRMRDVGLLEQALVDTGGAVVRNNEELVVTWPQNQGLFRRDTDGIWSAHFAEDVDLEEATALIREVDVAYGRRVQQTLVQRLRERAPAAGMDIESETVEQDETVTMVFNVTRMQA